MTTQVIPNSGRRARLRYGFDNLMARGTPALVGLLGLASAALVLAISSLAWLITPADVRANGNWLGVLWRSLLRTMDPGTMGGDEGSRLYLLLMFLITLGGIFIVSALISVLTTGLDAQIARLGKGRSRIIEQNHTVLLGWSDQVFIVLGELVEANASLRRPCVAILADLTRADMEDLIRQRLGTTGNTRVVCRSGDPLKAADVDLVSPETARSIIVVSPPADNPDVHVIKILLSLNARKWGPVRPPVVAAVSESGNLAAARLAGGAAAQVIDADDISIRLLVQSHRQIGLCTVCTDLLDFEGNELYLHQEASLTGRTFGEVLDAYDLGAPIGLRTASGVVILNPAMNTTLADTDELVVLAEDDMLIRTTTSPTPFHEAAITSPCPARLPATRTLMLGWNHRAPKIVQLLDSFAEPGSELLVASETGGPARRSWAGLVNTTLDFVECDLNDRAALEQLKVCGFDHLIVLSADNVDDQEADARTLVTLLHLRDIESQLGDVFSIVSEMNDDANREVAEVAQADDFVVSAKLISLYLTQLSENGQLGDVFAALFSPEGSEIHLKPAGAYLKPGVSTNFATVVESARRRGETAIGYRVQAQVRQSPRFGITLNPDKAAPLMLIPNDQVIVLAEN